jgi:hypothetical protein
VDNPSVTSDLPSGTRLAQTSEDDSKKSEEKTEDSATSDSGDAKEEKSEEPKTSDESATPPSDDTSTSTTPETPESATPAPTESTDTSTPSAEATPQPPQRTVEIVRYDPNGDLDLAGRYLDKIGGLVTNRRYNEMRVYASKLSRTLVYMEGHLPTVSLQVGLERVQTMLAQGQREKAAAEIQRLLGEMRSLPSLTPSSSVVAALSEIAQNLDGGGDLDTARESISEIRFIFTSPSDASAMVQEIRSSLTSLEIAISREAPEVIQTQVETLGELLGKLRSALSAQATIEMTQPQPPASPAPTVKPPTPTPTPTPPAANAKPATPPAAKPATPPAAKPATPPAAKPATPPAKPKT